VKTECDRFNFKSIERAKPPRYIFILSRDRS